MQIKPEITYRGFDRSEALDADIQARLRKLEQHYDRITSCQVVVEAHHHHHQQGNLFHVRIRLGVPGKELVISHDQHDKHAHEDAYVAVRDAFQSMERQLEEHARMLRGEVKNHVPPEE